MTETPSPERDSSTAIHCTLKPRQIDQLAEMESSRFGSRSEALRVAVETLYQEFATGGEQPIEQLIQEVQAAKTELSDLSNQIEELSSILSGPHSATHPSHHVGVPRVRQGMEDSPPPNPGEHIDYEVYEAVSQNGPRRKREIERELDLPPSWIDESVTRLLDRGLLIKDGGGDGEFYEVPPAGGTSDKNHE